LSAEYGVASGDPRPDQVVLWTRVPEAAQPSAGEAIAVQYEVATSPSFAPETIAVQGEVATESSADYTVKVTAEGLTPATSYYYRFWTATGYQSMVGRTKTAPATEAHPDLISFAFVSCQAFTDGFYTIFARLAQEDVGFCVHLGDTIYEQGSPAVEDYAVREDPIREATSLATYRQKYQRQRDAYTAFLEYMPIQPIEPLSPSGVPRIRLYRQFSLGDLLDLFALDERPYWDGVACERVFLSTACPELEDPARIMLGEAQKSW
jgi:alkaline phosphatase D